jgi:hypothetical protein
MITANRRNAIQTTSPTGAAIESMAQPLTLDVTLGYELPASD